jgi:hypothetical protein
LVPPTRIVLLNDTWIGGFGLHVDWESVLAEGLVPVVSGNGSGHLDRVPDQVHETEPVPEFPYEQRC